MLEALSRGLEGSHVIEGIEPFGLILLLAAVVGSLALVSNRISQRLRVPAPAIFLLAAAVASELLPQLGRVSIETVQQIVTVALILILFDGGMGIGLAKLRRAWAPVLSVGVIGTVLTAAAVAAVANLLFGVPWLLALLLGTALAPTDPAVVFSVLGGREIGGRAGVIIEGESGANDPVGIALLVSLLAVQQLDAGAVVNVLGTFTLQMLIGTAVGVGGGWLLQRAMRQPLPNAALYPLRTLAIAIGLYGIATVAHGSGFLAVFIAGIVIGDPSAPYKRDIERFHSSMAGLAEIVAFVVLGLTISLSDVVASGAWWAGLVLAVLLGFLLRPLLVGPLLLAVRLTVGERLFVLWSGLKGAVPILLGTYILGAGGDANRWAYEVIFVVVAFSVIVQGGLVPTVAQRCRVRMRDVPPRPWSVGMRLRDEPDSVRQYRIRKGALAEGRTVAELHRSHDVWVSMVVRDGNALRVHPDTVLRSGDEVLLLVDPPAEPGYAFEPS